LMIHAGRCRVPIPRRWNDPRVFVSIKNAWSLPSQATLTTPTRRRLRFAPSPSRGCAGGSCPTIRSRPCLHRKPQGRIAPCHQAGRARRTAHRLGSRWARRNAIPLCPGVIAEHSPSRASDSQPAVHISASLRDNLDMYLRVASAIALVALVAAGSAAARPATKTHFFTAFVAGRLNPDLTITRRVSGSCSARSEVEGRPFVWWCDFSHFLADPCFSATATSAGAFCPLAPWSHRGIFIVARLHDWKPSTPQIIKTWPWGVWTTTGKRCVAIRTGTSRIRGLRVNHGCGGGGFLVGPVDRHSTRWTILYGSRFNGDKTRLSRVGITDAWW